MSSGSNDKEMTGSGGGCFGRRSTSSRIRRANRSTSFLSSLSTMTPPPYPYPTPYAPSTTPSLFDLDDAETDRILQECLDDDNNNNNTFQDGSYWNADNIDIGIGTIGSNLMMMNINCDSSWNDVGTTTDASPPPAAADDDYDAPGSIMRSEVNLVSLSNNSEDSSTTTTMETTRSNSYNNLDKFLQNVLNSDVGNYGDDGTPGSNDSVVSMTTPDDNILGDLKNYDLDDNICAFSGIDNDGNEHARPPCVLLEEATSLQTAEDRVLPESASNEYLWNRTTELEYRNKKLSSQNMELLSRLEEDDTDSRRIYKLQGGTTFTTVQAQNTCSEAFRDFFNSNNHHSASSTTGLDVDTPPPPPAKAVPQNSFHEYQSICTEQDKPNPVENTNFHHASAAGVSNEATVAAAVGADARKITPAPGQLLETDFCLGRGGRVNMRQGNIDVRNLRDTFIPRLLACQSAPGRKSIKGEFEQLLKEREIRFMEEGPEEGNWSEVSEDTKSKCIQTLLQPNTIKRRLKCLDNGSTLGSQKGKSSRKKRAKRSPKKYAARLPQAP